MIRIEHSIGPSIYGIGLFTEEKIKKGQLVMDADSRFDVIISKEEIKTYPDVMQKHIDKYAYTGAGKFYLKDAVYYNMDNSRFINHSDTPNLTYNPTDECYYASEDLEAGMELTTNYADFCEPGHLCFSFYSHSKI